MPAAYATTLARGYDHNPSLWAVFVTSPPTLNAYKVRAKDGSATIKLVKVLEEDD